jgi:hypothetical protein
MLNNNQLAPPNTPYPNVSSPTLQASKSKSVSVAKEISYVYPDEKSQLTSQDNNHSPSKPIRSLTSPLSNKSSPTKSPLKSIPVSPSSSSYNLKSPRRGYSFRVQLENDYKSKATRDITNEELEKMSKQAENNFVENFLKKLTEKEKSKYRPPPHPNSSHNRIKSFYLDPQDSSSLNSKRPGSAKSLTPSNHTTSRSTSTTSSKQQQNYYYYYNGRAVSSMSKQSNTQNPSLTVIPERLIKSAPPLVPVRIPDDRIRSDARYFKRAKIHYVNMSINSEKAKEDDSISQLSNNPSIFVSICLSFLIFNRIKKCLF